MMPVLTPGRPLRSREPRLLVENTLDPGAWRFLLTVIDDQRNESTPAELRVTIGRVREPPLRDPLGRFVRRPGA